MNINDVTKTKAVSTVLDYLEEGQWFLFAGELHCLVRKTELESKLTAMNIECGYALDFPRDAKVLKVTIDSINYITEITNDKTNL